MTIWILMAPSVLGFPVCTRHFLQMAESCAPFWYRCCSDGTVCAELTAAALRVTDVCLLSVKRRSSPLEIPCSICWLLFLIITAKG